MNKVRNFFRLLFAVFSILLMASCGRRSDNKLFVIQCRDFSNARFLEANVIDYWAWDASKYAEYESDEEEQFDRESFTEIVMGLDSTQWPLDQARSAASHPVFFHRASGRTDTIYATGGFSFDIGYISRYTEYDDWTVIESKPVWMIVDSTDIREESRHLRYPHLEECTYRGQKKVFDSDISVFWLVSQTAPDIYGPLSESELKNTLVANSIPLPVKISGFSDYYLFYGDLDDYRNVRPKRSFLERMIPDLIARPDKVIQ